MFYVAPSVNGNKRNDVDNFPALFPFSSILKTYVY